MADSLIELIKEPYMALFVVLAVGGFLSQLRIGGFSLGSSAIILVAIFMGHLGVVVPPAVEVIGLVLFIFAVGIQAGPGFFEAFKTGEARQFLLPLGLILLLSFLGCYLGGKWLGLSPLVTVGFFSGISTSTATLASVVDSSQSIEPILSYSVSYPIAMISSILCLKLLPKIIGLDVAAEERRFKAQTERLHPRLELRQLVVENPNVAGTTIGELKIHSMTGGLIRRILRAGATKGQIPKTDDALALGDIIEVVGPPTALDRLKILIGRSTDVKIPSTKSEEILWILVTEKKVVGKPLWELNLNQTFGVHISQIRRAGIDLVPTGETRLRFGDKILVTTPVETRSELLNWLGGVEPKAIDFLPLGLSIALGMFIGKLDFPIGGFEFQPGVAAGVLIVTLVLGHLGKTGPLLWSIAGDTNQFLKQLGLTFFLCGTGTRSGQELGAAFESHGWALVLLAALIPPIMILITTFVTLKVSKINRLQFMGALTASLTNAAAIATVSDSTNSRIPDMAYSVTYPFALLATIVLGQLIAFLP